MSFFIYNNVTKTAIMYGLLTIFINCIVMFSYNSTLGENTEISFRNEKKVREAIFKENWTKIIELLDWVNDETLSPVARMIKGHAYLAINKNNESLCMFLSVLTEDSLKSRQSIKQWNEWSQKFLDHNPKLAVAHYFQADAQARLKKWDTAIETFNHALTIIPKHYLVLNARGAAFAAKGEWDYALIDFVEATKSNPSFADTYASLGAMWIQRRTGAKGAIKAFNAALKISSDFSLALNGLACAQFALGKWDDAINNFKEAGESNECFEMPLINLITLSEMKEKFLTQNGKELAQLKPGMSTELISRYAKSLSPIQAQQNYRQAEWNRKWSTMGATLGDIISGFAGRFTQGGGLNASAGIRGIDIGAMTNQRFTILTNFESFGRNLAQTSRRDAQYWSSMRDMIGTTHSMNKMMPAGVTAKDLQHAYVDEGNWLDTGYGLVYHVEPVDLTYNQ